MTGVRGVHIGDGVYLDWDGNAWWLSTERLNGTNRIALEGDALVTLVGFAVRTAPLLAPAIVAAMPS